jgi:hypothetical protein
VLITNTYEASQDAPGHAAGATAVFTAIPMSEQSEPGFQQFIALLSVWKLCWSLAVSLAGAGFAVHNHIVNALLEAKQDESTIAYSYL